MMDDFYKMYNAYKTKKAHHPIMDTEWANTFHGNERLPKCDKNINIKVVGAFDTVSVQSQDLIFQEFGLMVDRSEPLAGQTTPT
jgi:hypothetical protein